MLGCQEVGLGPLVRIVHGKINLKFENCSLVESLLDEVDAVPFGERRVFEILRLGSPGQALLGGRVRVGTSGHHEHAYDGVLLQQFVIHLENVVARQQLLVLRKLQLGVTLLLEAEAGRRMASTARIGTVSLIVIVDVPLLKMAHKLLKCIGYLVLIGGTAIHLID